MVWWKSDEYCKVKPVIDHHHTNYFNLSDLEMHNIAWIVAGFFTAVASILSIVQIYRHCASYTNPRQQKHIIRIMLMVPVYAIDSFLSFRFYWLSVYFDTVRDCYEAFVIYTFYSLLIEYVGGYHDGKEIFSKKGSFKLAVPLSCITVQPRRGLLRQIKRLTLQYVIIRPAMTFLALILHSVGEYCPGNFSPLHAYPYVTFVNFISVTVAMYALVQFYTVSKEEIASYKPLPKFLSVKLVIFLSFWQMIVVAGLVQVNVFKATTYWSTDNIATGVEDALLCCEMVIAAIWHYTAFDVHEFETGEKTPVLKSAADSFNPYDIAEDVYYSFFPKKSISKIRKNLVKKFHKNKTYNTADNSTDKTSLVGEQQEEEGEGEEYGNQSQNQNQNQKRQSVYVQISTEGMQGGEDEENNFEGTVKVGSLSNI